MRRRENKYKVNHNSEFELDLAPLLAVMVKLVPVLIVSSAFVQILTIETDLPQTVKEAIAQEEQISEKPVISIHISKTDGIKITTLHKREEKIKLLPLLKGQVDYTNLHLALIQIKKEYPQHFRIELNPDKDVNYQDIVKIMDEARKCRDKKIKFPIFDKAKNKNIETDYMFPDVVFTNMMEG